MQSKAKLILSLAILVTLGWLVWRTPKRNVESTGSNSGASAQNIAQTASSGVGVVGKSSDGSKGAPVMVLEELHNSRAGQIQHAVTLVRLHDRYGLRDIALEGYIKGSPPVDVSWFVRANPGSDAVARARVAVRFLKEGEISAAEFVKLVYEDVQLRPTETSATYDAKLTSDFMDGLAAYLSQLSDAGDTWAQDQLNDYQNPKIILSRSAEEHIGVAEEAERRAKGRGIELTAKQRESWRHYMEFWQQRIAGSRLIVETADNNADREGVSVVAMEIGTAHTDGICQMLERDNRPFAVITPLATKSGDTRGDLTDAFDRKYASLSVFSQGFTTLLLRLFPPAKVIPGRRGGEEAATGSGAGVV